MKFIALLSLLVAGAFANARPYTKNMTCEQAADLVKANGAVVMNYDYSDRAGWLYERFVAHGGYCGSGEEAQAAWVETRNSASCFVGYVCRPNSHD